MSQLRAELRTAMNLLDPSAEGFSEHKAFVFGDTGLKERRQWH